MVRSHSPNALTICVAGPVFLDIVMQGLEHAPHPGEEQWVNGCEIMPGGAANQAIASAKLGIKSQLLSYLGADKPGQWVREMLLAENIDLTSTSITSRQNITVAQMLGNDRAFTSFGTDTTPPPPANFEPPNILLCSLKFLRDHGKKVDAWREKHTLVIADSGWDETEEWPVADLDLLQHADIFVPNEQEALNYTRSQTLSEASEILARHVDTSIITCGGKGIVVVQHLNDNVNVQYLPAIKTQLVDTTGAGDTFSAGLAVALAHHIDIITAAQFGQCTAAWTVSRIGGSYAAPTLADLESWAAKNNHESRYILTTLTAIKKYHQSMQ